MFHNQFLNVGVGSFYRMSQFLQTLQTKEQYKNSGMHPGQKLFQITTLLYHAIIEIKTLSDLEKIS